MGGSGGRSPTKPRKCSRYRGLGATLGGPRRAGRACGPGPGPRTLGLGAHGQAGVQICYEIVFSGEVAERGHRPDYIFNPSNDGWFGAHGPPQHLAQARMRAIEEGLPVLRSTTTGISAVIDARGVVRRHLGHLAGGRIDGVIPPPSAPTLFARLGNGLALLWAMVFLLAAYIASQRRRG